MSWLSWKVDVLDMMSMQTSIDDFKVEEYEVYLTKVQDLWGKGQYQGSLQDYAYDVANLEAISSGSARKVVRLTRGKGDRSG